MKRLLVPLLALATLGGGVTAAYAENIAPFLTSSSPAIVSPHLSPLSCTTGSFFKTLNGQLSTSSNAVSWTNVGAVNPIMTALAFSPSSGYLYAISSASGSTYNQLVRIGAGGAQSVLGTVTNLPSSIHWNGGDIDPATNTYYVSPGGSTLFAINLTTRVATRVSLPARVTLGYDLVVEQGWIWSASRSTLDGFSLTTSSTKEFTIPSADQGDSAGSMWSDLSHDGVYFMWDNTGHVIHAVGLRSPSLSFTHVATTPTHGKTNDGATCNAASTPGPDTAPVLGISGSSITNLGPGKLQRVDLSLSNSYGAPVTVWPRVIKIALSDSSSSCPAATNFAVDQSLTVQVRVPAHSTMTLHQLGVPQADWPLVTMLDTTSNQNACEGTTVTMSYYIRYHS